MHQNRLLYSRFLGHTPRLSDIVVGLGQVQRIHISNKP